MSSTGKLVLVTGATGFIAGHVVDKFLEAGYRVRGTTRGSKVKFLTDTIQRPGLEFVQVDDVAASDLTAALKDVYAVIHVASPLPSRASVDDTLKTAEEGTLNVLKQAATAGIEKIVVTSSVGAILDPDFHTAYGGTGLSDSDWGEVTREQVYVKADDPVYVYFASKILAEKVAWNFAKEHPEIDLATILPVYVYGPFSRTFPYPSLNNLGTDRHIYSVITGESTTQSPPWVVDVRDIAQGHVLALSLPRAAPEQKRFLLCGGNLTWKEAAAYLNTVRPEIKTLPQNKFDDLPGKPTPLDVSRSIKVLGLDYIKPEKMVLDTVDSLIEIQKSQAA